MSRRAMWAGLALAAWAPLTLAEEPAHADSPRVLDVLTREAQQVLLEADRFEVMAIECERRPEPGEDALNDYPVEKRSDVPSREDRVRLLSRLYQGIDEGAEPAVCFLPHHAVRATRGQQVVELIVCFTCNLMLAHGTGVRAPRQGPYVVISRAAAEELGRLIGPRDWQRVVGGKRLDAWWSRFKAAAREEEGPRLEPGDEAGVVAVAEALGWGRPRTVHESVEALRALGPAAAPALPALRRHLEADLDHPACRAALRVLEAVGPAAAPAALGVLTRLREALAVAPTDPVRPHADLVAHAAVRALGAIGPAAADAVPALERLADRADLGEAAREALQRIRGQR